MKCQDRALGKGQIMEIAVINGLQLASREF